MQKIVCNQCGGKWYVDNNDNAQMKCCLYCQKPLRQKKEITTLDALDKVIFKAVSSLGTDALSQPRQLAGYMMDIAPEFKKELRILTRALSDEYYTIVRDAFAKDITSAELLLSKLRTLLIEDDGLSESWADILCNSYMGAIRYFHGIGLEETLLASVENYEPAPVVVHVPAPSAKAPRTANSSKTTPAQPKVPASKPKPNSSSNYRCQVCGYRIDDISSDLKCPICKAQRWESINAVPPSKSPARTPTPQAPRPPQPAYVASTTTSSPPEESTGYSASNLLTDARAHIKKKDYSAAATTLQNNALKEHAEAQYELGMLYLHGLGVPKFLSTAEGCFRTAAQKGYVPAYVRLGKILFEQGKYKVAWKWFSKAAELEDPEGLYYASVFYERGYHVKQNLWTAKQYFDKALQANSVDAHLQMAKVSHKKKDYAVAIKHFTIAANLGNAEAQYYMGEYLSSGFGTGKDLLAAAQWYQKAAKQNYANAQSALTACINAMSFTQKIKWNMSQ